MCCACAVGLPPHVHTARCVALASCVHNACCGVLAAACSLLLASSGVLSWMVLFARMARSATLRLSVVGVLLWAVAQEFHTYVKRCMCCGVLWCAVVCCGVVCCGVLS
jgi:hypothetical protein